MDINYGNQKCQVIIIGAGAAGIGAAIRLKKQNVPIIILQARDRLGGRLIAQKIDDVFIDLGASWIHSYSENNPLKVHVEQEQVCQAVLKKHEIRSVWIDGQEGKQFDENILEIAQMNCNYCMKLCKQKVKKQNRDFSIYQGAKQYLEGTVSKFNPSEKRCTALMINMYEHYEGSSMYQISTNYHQFRKDCGGDFLPDGSYGELLKKIVKTAELNILYNKVVEKIYYRQNQVRIQCKDGSIYTAQKLISSLPLGVLKSEKIKFDPELPQQYKNSIKNMGCGLMNKIIVAFEEDFWGPVRWIKIGCDERGKFSNIYNFSQKCKHLLCCFITDDFARKMQKQPSEYILEQFLKVLRKIYPGKNIKVKDSIITRWGQQQFSLGSYASFHAGSSPEDCYQMRKPILNTLWMVGQHCYAEHIGTAHGAFRTGHWAADQALKQMKWVNPQQKSPKKMANQKKIWLP